MRYTDKQLAPIFASYWGAKVIWYNNEERESNVSVLAVNRTYLALEMLDKSGKERFAPVSYMECKLVLTPLSLITDEHCIEIAKIVTRNVYKEDLTYKMIGSHADRKEVLVGKGVCVTICFDGSISASNVLVRILFLPVENTNEITDFLRSQHYDIGHGSIKSLIGAGIAIKK